MMILRLEFVHESERTQLLKKIREDYIIVEESKVTPSKKKNSKKLLQFIEIENGSSGTTHWYNENENRNVKRRNRNE